MARKRSQRLVIDASIAHAAGPEGAVHPTAKNCRDFLLAVLEVCHRAVFAPAIAAEWKRHQSSFARQWRVSMFARKKIDHVVVREDAGIRQQVEQLAEDDSQSADMLKDLHLVEAALATGMRVASLDETVRGHFRAAAASVARLRRICWINPDVPAEDAISWLEAGAPAHEFRTLGYVRPE
jgi:hypothetical protein